MKKNTLIITALLCSTVLASCASQDHFVMRNEKTGEEVVCKSEPYWIMPPIDAYHIANQCTRACQRFGFRRDDPSEPFLPADPHPDVKPFIPAQCL